MSNNFTLTHLWACITLCFACFASPSTSRAETNPKFYAVEVSATVQASPAKVTLTWPADANATGYTIYRKAFDATSWNHLGSVAGSATAWSDSAVVDGGAYEYRIDKSTTLSYRGYGYVYAGINAPMTDARGKVLLIVDNTHAADLAPELTRLQQDLVGDGWTVVRKDFARADSAATVRNYIRSAHAADPVNTKAVFLFGHIAVPYSGNYAPDGHPDHQGAWPADSYYGDVDGTWTDSSVNTTSAHRPANHNVAGDGKLDQSTLPSDVDLYVGRVDLYNMTCYANKSPSRSEKDLLRQYLNKDHAFRHKKFSLERRGLICDNFGESGGEAFASSGWRNFAPFFGANNVQQVGWGSFFPTLASQAYLWAYGTGGGSYYTCNGVGGSDDFAVNDPKAVFMMFLGSYFGDWDNESNFLRAPLGTTSYGLTACWAGRPHWFFHHMGLGETIGYGTKLSQNNSSLYPALMNWCARQTQSALMGDPTLRMHTVSPVADVEAVLSGSTATVSWSPSTDTEIVGYHVYESASAQGPFTRLTSATVSGTSFSDASSASGRVYMVRAVKLERSGSGTYYNPSQGVFTTVGGTTTEPTPTTPPPTTSEPTPPAPSALRLTVVSSTQINLDWTDNANNETTFQVERKLGATGAWALVGTLGANAEVWANNALTAGTLYYYRVRASNAGGYSAYSNEASASTTPIATSTTGKATFVKLDGTTGGTWKGVYGTDGAMVLGEGATALKYATVTPSGNYSHVWNWSTADARAVQKVSNTDRVAACWYHPTAFTFDVNITDGQTHPLAIYALDWDAAGRVQTVELLDAATGTVLNKQTLSGFTKGAYLVWNVSGKVRVRVTTVYGNAVVSGIYIGAATVATPTPTPPPTSTGLAAARFVTVDATTQGNWKGVYGSDGHYVIGISKVLPSYVTIGASGTTAWIWQWPATGTHALLKNLLSDQRIAACWYSKTAYTVHANIADTSTHRVAVYCLDWDGIGREQRVEVIDAVSGSVLDSRVVGDFSNGKYLVWDVKGKVNFRVTNLRGAAGNAVTSGMFFSPSPTKL